MNVVKAQYAGACFGVARALDIAFNACEQSMASSGGSVYTFGPLIHNPLVVASLSERGVEKIDSLDRVRPEDTVIIRSHGVTPDVMRAVHSKTVHVLDATCPFVAKAQRAASHLASEYGCVVVVGEAGHPEVEGLRAYALEEDARVVVAATIDDLPENLEGHVGVVVQTTQEKDVLDAIVAQLVSRGIAVDVKNTICTATSQRQSAAWQLAGEVDAMVVIGGRNSSNTTRLASICKNACPRTYHIEDSSEIDAAWFVGCATIGVTAGASTPDSQIDAVIDLLESL